MTSINGKLLVEASPRHSLGDFRKMGMENSNIQIPADIEKLQAGLSASIDNAKAVAAELSEEEGVRRLHEGSWSVSECLDHLAVGNEVYLAAMFSPAEQGRQRGRLRRRAAAPGWLGRLFVAALEPPARRWLKIQMPGKIRPRPSPPLGPTLSRYLASQEEVRSYLARNADLDLHGIRFPNPFIPGLRFSLATGLHVLDAHSRRHLWQAWKVRRSIEGRATG